MTSDREWNAAVWRKSSHSGAGDESGQNSCLEVADHIPGLVPVRDSKNPQGPALVFPAPAWAAFIAVLR
ncbi:DUF397 domain-containing protein [Streptomyces cinnamoneus]|uniref:DUF397 domain-containing protein n=1 Tax=Streptomyces cinnamoneus TaxID=53446 RepID=UPI0033CD9207